MTENPYRPLKFAALGAGLALITASSIYACSKADAAVYYGGTGTGYVATDPGTAFTAIFAPDAAVTTSVVYDSAPWANPYVVGPSGAEAVKNDPDKIVIGLSRGAQAADAVERLDPDPTTKYFYVGSPNGPNGLSSSFGASPPAVDPTHDVTHVYAEFDGVADFPDRPLAGFGLPVINGLLGAFSPSGPHQHYADGTELDPLTRLDEAEVEVRDNLDADGKPNGTTTTRMRIPTHAMPIETAVRDTLRTWKVPGGDKIAEDVGNALEPLVKSGYARYDDEESTDESGTDAADGQRSGTKDRSAAGRDSGSSESSSDSGSSDTGSGSE